MKLPFWSSASHKLDRDAFLPSSTWEVEEEDRKFKVTLCYIVNLRPAWDA